MKEIDRNEVLILIDVLRQLFSSNAEGQNSVSEAVSKLYTQATSNLDHDVNYEYGFSNNGFLAQIYEVVFAERVRVVGDPPVSYKCHCCGASSLHEEREFHESLGYFLGSYEICLYCGWEDDGITELDVGSSVNRGSISEYLENLKDKKDVVIKDRWNF